MNILEYTKEEGFICALDVTALVLEAVVLVLIDAVDAAADAADAADVDVDVDAVEDFSFNNQN